MLKQLILSKILFVILLYELNIKLVPRQDWFWLGAYYKAFFKAQDKIRYYRWEKYHKDGYVVADSLKKTWNGEKVDEDSKMEDSFDTSSPKASDRNDRCLMATTNSNKKELEVHSYDCSKTYPTYILCEHTSRYGNLLCRPE